MPSEDPKILELFAQPLGAFRAAVATTISQLRGMLADLTEPGKGQPDPATELGAFAAGRIDAGRFTAVLSRKKVEVEPALAARIQQAHDTLVALSAKKDDLFRLDVPSGTCLHGAVSRALADIGRAFGAARVVELATSQSFVEADHAAWLDAFGYALWNAKERGIAPPLVVEVDGADLHAGHVAEYLDGQLKLVLVVRGDSPPAPLVGLVSPRVLVLQTQKPEDLQQLADFDGPGVAALVSEGAATWIHEPGTALRIQSAPEAASKQAVGGISKWQQAEQLEQLQSLAGKRAAAAAPPSGDGQVAAAVPPPSDPVDKLAAWLLTQADLEGLE
jgi:hypothetical protein